MSDIDKIEQAIDSVSQLTDSVSQLLNITKKDISNVRIKESTLINEITKLKNDSNLVQNDPNLLEENKMLKFIVDDVTKRLSTAENTLNSLPTKDIGFLSVHKQLEEALYEKKNLIEQVNTLNEQLKNSKNFDSIQKEFEKRQTELMCQFENQSKLLADSIKNTPKKRGRPPKEQD